MTIIFRIPNAPKSNPDDWMNETDPDLRYYKFMISHVDWEEWPGGAAEIQSAYSTQREKIEEMKAVLLRWQEFASDVQPGCAAGAELLEELRSKTTAFLEPTW